MWKNLLTLGIALFASSGDAKMRPYKMNEAPYGSWKSPITPESIASKAIALIGVQEVDGAIYLFESRPAEKGRSTLLRMTGEGSFEELIPAEYNIRTTVHEYGGGSRLIVGDTLYFSNFSDQQLYRRDPLQQDNFLQILHVLP